eukprot:g1847.t1
MLLRTIIFVTALLAAPASASSGNHICTLPSLWTPSQSHGGNTCETILNNEVGANQVLNGIDFTKKVDCSSLTDTQKGKIDTIASVCCGSLGAKASPCRDRGYVCIHPEYFRPGDTEGVATESSNTAADCDELVVARMSTGDLAQHNLDFTRPVSCGSPKWDPSVAEIKREVKKIAKLCCRGSTKRLTQNEAEKYASACTDHSHICKYGGLYTPDATYMLPPVTAKQHHLTCDWAITHLTYSGRDLAGKDFSTEFSCASQSAMVKKAVNGFAAKCCGSFGVEASPCYGLLSACSKTSGLEANTDDCQCGTTQCDAQSGRYCTLSSNTCDNGLLGKITALSSSINPVCKVEGRRLASDGGCRNLLLSHATTTSFSTLTQIAVLIVCLGFF